MKRIFVYSVIAFLPFSLLAQNLDEVLQKHFKSINQEKLSSVSSLQVKGKLSQMGQQMPFKMTQLRPLKFRLDITFQGLTISQAYDGAKGWSVNPFMGDDEAKEIPASGVKNLKVQADMDGALFNWNEKGYTAELLQNEKVEGIESHVILLKDTDGDEFKIFIDTETSLILKQTYKVDTQQGPMTLEIYPSDYRDVEGMKVAFAIETKADGQTVYSMKYDTVELNPKVDDSYFAMPK